MAIYTPSPSTRKAKVTYTGSKYPRGHPPALGATRVNKKKVPVVPRISVVPKITRRVVDPLTQIYNRYKAASLTDAQMQTKAQSWVESQLNPNIDLVKSEAERLRGEAAKRRDAMSAAYMSAAAANQQMAPQVLAGFTSAASTLGSLAGAATGQVGAAMRADVAQQSADLARVGQGGPNIGDPAQQQGVENYVGGYLPAANLAEMGAFAQKGFLGQVADQRQQAVSIPWGDYNDTISQLDTQELTDLKELAMKRPDLVQGVLEKLTAQNEKNLGGMLDVEKERADRQQQLAKIQQAEANLKFKYQDARLKATTTAQKLALDRWYKGQEVALSSARNSISQQGTMGRLAVSQQNANTSAGRLTLAQQIAKDKAKQYGPGGVKYKSMADVMASVVRSRRDVPAAKGSREKIKLALFEGYKRSVPPAQWAELKRAISDWVYKLPVHASSSSGPSLFPKNTGG